MSFHPQDMGKKARALLARAAQAARNYQEVLREQHDPSAPPVIGYRVPVVGCGLTYGLKGPRLLRELQQKHGDTFTLYLMGRPITLSQEPAHMKRLYSAPVQEVSFFEGLKAFRGYGDVLPIGVSGPEDANVGMMTLRKVLGPLVQESTELLDAETRWRMTRVFEASSVDLLDTMRACIIHQSARLIVGEELARDTLFAEAVVAFDAAMLAMVRALRVGKLVEQALRARDTVVRLVSVEVQRRRALPAIDPPRDFLDAMCVAIDVEGRRFSPEVVATECLGYMFGTTANTPAAGAMCLLHILSEPDLHARVVEEQSRLRELDGDKVQSSSLRDMHLLNACFQETLRFYAPGLHLRLNLEASEAGGHTLPKGRMIAYSPYLAHHDPAVYSDPEVFDPDRFLSGPRSPASKPSAAAFVPFGRGVHACLGKSLARAEVMITIARLLRDYDAVLAPHPHVQAVDWNTNGLAAPKGKRQLRCTRRTSVQRSHTMLRDTTRD